MFVRVYKVSVLWQLPAWWIILITLPRAKLMLMSHLWLSCKARRRWLTQDTCRVRLPAGGEREATGCPSRNIIFRDYLNMLYEYIRISLQHSLLPPRKCKQ